MIVALFCATTRLTADPLVAPAEAPEKPEALEPDDTESDLAPTWHAPPRTQTQGTVALAVLASAAYLTLWLDLRMAKRRRLLAWVDEWIENEVACYDPRFAEWSPQSRLRSSAFFGTPFLLSAVVAGSTAGIGGLTAAWRPARKPDIFAGAGGAMLLAGGVSWIWARHLALPGKCWSGPSRRSCLERRFDTVSVTYGLSVGIISVGAGLLTYGLHARVAPQLVLGPGKGYVGITTRF